MNMTSMIMTYRPMSQMLRLLVIPEIETRIAAGTLNAAQLPLQLRQFRVLLGEGQNIVEINDEVKLVVTMSVKRAVTAGEFLTLGDVDPDDCFLEPPRINNKPASFFLCRSSFLNFMTIFDFSSAAPMQPPDGPEASPPMRYPLADWVYAEQLAKSIEPLEMYRRLATASWPPGPGHYPGVLWRMQKDLKTVETPEFSEIVASAYDERCWKERVTFWTETHFFGDRLPYVTKVIDEYLAGDYVASIHVLVPHFEGIVRDYLDGAGVEHRYRFESCVKDLKALVLSRTALMFPRPVLDQVFSFIEHGTFLTETGNVSDPASEVTRHGIAHGVFKNFENRDIALKYLILLDTLGYVLLHDKLVTGAL